MYILKKVGAESSILLKQLMRNTFKQAYKDMHTKKNIEEYCRVNFTDDIVTKFLSSDIYICTIAFKEEQAVGFSILKDE